MWSGKSVELWEGDRLVVDWIGIPLGEYVAGALILSYYTQRTCHGTCFWVYPNGNKKCTDFTVTMF